MVTDAGGVRREAVHVDVEVEVRGEDEGDGRRVDARVVALHRVRAEAVLRLGAADDEVAERGDVHAGRAPAHEVVGRGDVLVRDLLVGEALDGACLAEQEVRGRVVDRQGYGGGVERRGHGGKNARAVMGSSRTCPVVRQVTGVRAVSWRA